MEEKYQELKWRRTAIRLILKGLRPCDILKQLPHGREWLRKWWHRCEQLGWDGLNNQARTPHHSPQAFDKPSRAVVLRVRRALEQRQIGLIGAKAVRQEIIRQHLLNEVPSLATIKRWLHEAGLTHAEATRSAERLLSATRLVDRTGAARLRIACSLFGRRRKSLHLSYH